MGGHLPIGGAAIGAQGMDKPPRHVPAEDFVPKRERFLRAR